MRFRFFLTDYVSSLRGAFFDLFELAELASSSEHRIIGIWLCFGGDVRFVIKLAWYYLEVDETTSPSEEEIAKVEATFGEPIWKS